MCVLSIKVPIRKKSGNLFNDPCIFIILPDLPKSTGFPHINIYFDFLISQTQKSSGQQNWEITISIE